MLPWIESFDRLSDTLISINRPDPQCGQKNEIKNTLFRCGMSEEYTNVIICNIILNFEMFRRSWSAVKWCVLEPTHPCNAEAAELKQNANLLTISINHQSKCPLQTFRISTFEILILRGSLEFLEQDYFFGHRSHLASDPFKCDVSNKIVLWTYSFVSTFSKK